MCPARALAQVADLRAGDSFGQLSASTGRQRSASVVARSCVELVVISSKHYKGLILPSQTSLMFVPRLAVDVFKKKCARRRMRCAEAHLTLHAAL